MTAASRTMDEAECIEHLGSRGVGRAAICAPAGPEIHPVNFVVDHDSIVFRTSANRALAMLGHGKAIAFEVDSLDDERHSGWGVVATGIAEDVTDEAELDMLRERGLEPAAWASGLRRSYVRLRWSRISGLVVGEGSA